jgi:tetratricopeptide (TPR) repeat protein
VHFLLAYAMDNQGVVRRKESLEILQRGLDVDPFNSGLSQLAATRLVEFGRFREAMELLDRFQVLPQGKRDVWGWQLEVLNNNGRYDEQLAVLIEIMRSDVHVYDQMFPALGQLWRLVSSVAYLGLTEEAEGLYAVVDKTPDPGPDRWWRQHFFKDSYLYATGRGDEVTRRELEKIAGLSNEAILKAWLPEAGTNAMAFWEIGERERAIELMEAMQLFPYETSRWAERQMQFPMLLADWYMQVGRTDDAVPVLRKVVAHLQAEVDAGVRHPETLMLLASAYGWLGNDESAMDMLNLAIDYDGHYLELCCEDYSSVDLEERVWWDGLENYPRFIQSRSRMRAIVDMQRSNIRSLLAQNDIEQLLAPLIQVPGPDAD